MENFDPMAHRAMQPGPEMVKRAQEVADYAMRNNVELGFIVGRLRAIAIDYRKRSGRTDLGDIDALQLLLDLAIAGCDRELELSKMMMASSTDISHDMNQIHLHINRQTWRMPLAVPMLFARVGERGGLTALNSQIIIR